MNSMYPYQNQNCVPESELLIHLQTHHQTANISIHINILTFYSKDFSLTKNLSIFFLKKTHCRQCTGVYIIFFINKRAYRKMNIIYHLSESHIISPIIYNTSDSWSQNIFIIFQQCPRIDRINENILKHLRVL